MNVQKEIRKVFKFLQQKEQGHNTHGNNGYIILSNKKYFVGCMSYDEWYIEPYKQSRTEHDDFSRATLWEKSDTIQILQIFADNDLLDVKAR